MASADQHEANEIATDVSYAVGAPWEQLMNESPGVPIIAVVDDDASVRESLAGLAESVGHEAALFASAAEFMQSDRDLWHA